MKKEIIRKTETQSKFKKVLSQLLVNNDIQDITTTQICKLANMNRSTFYANYYDQYDLYDDLKKDLLEECYKTLSNAFLDKETIKSFLLLIKSNLIIQAFLIKTTDNSFVNALKENEKEPIKQLKQNINN